MGANLVVRSRRIASWLLRDPWPVWLALIPPVVAILAGWYLPFEPELRVRVAGFAVTLAGVGLVVKGIQEKRALFGRPSFGSRIKSWVSRLPAVFGKPRAVVAKASISAGGAVAMGEAYVTTSASADAPVEQRLAVLEENLKRANDRISRLGERLNTEVNRLTAAISTETSARQAGDREVRERIEELSVGGLDLEAAGVVWVLAGTTYSTFPAELAALVGRILG